MTRRLRRSGHGLLLAGFLGLLPTLGCVTLLPPAADIPAVPGGPGSATAAKPELPPAQSAKVCLKLAESFEKSGHEAEALVQYEKARHYDPKLQLSRRLAVLYDRLGNHKQALAEYQQALKESPRDVELLNNIGYYYYSRGKWSEAEVHLRQALTLNPKHQRAWINLGLALGQQQRYDESLQAFCKVLSEAEAKSNLGFILTTQCKREEARQAYRDALRLEPGLRIAQLALDKLDHPGSPSEVAPTNRGDRPSAAPPKPPAAEVLPDLSPVVVAPGQP
jgi:tetratricopeptide (TPR) repeat protein